MAAKVEKPRKFKHGDTLDYSTPDVHGKIVDDGFQLLIGRRFVHSGNGKTYELVGFSWLGETDEWGFVMSRVTDDGLVAPPITRPLEHLTGDRSDGTPRYRALETN